LLVLRAWFGVTNADVNTLDDYATFLWYNPQYAPFFALIVSGNNADLVALLNV
jgi:hypothetical protein